jgi:DNA-binding NtrC family response regulator
MNAALPPILVVDDETNMRATLQNILGGQGYKVKAEESAERALRLLEQEPVFAVIADVHLGGMNGMELLERVRRRWPDVQMAMITAYARPREAVEAIQGGASDYLAKPFEPEQLLHLVRKMAETYRRQRENAGRAEARDTIQLDQIIGDCPKIRELRETIRQVAPSDATVLILGESGTGKELVAGAVHALSRRAQAPYVRINCAAIPETLLESELFGHERGSFTGALRQKTGRVEEADGGTIFLDEIGDMSRALQAKLLRFLENGTFTRVGGNEQLRVNVRLIAATNRDIVAAIRQNQFREDLFHRLNVVQLCPPPLRERGRDVLLLAGYFLRQCSAAMNKTVVRLSPGAEDKLLAHYWPGNVRELRNAIERGVILEATEELRARNLPNFEIETRLYYRTDQPPAAAGASPEEVLAAPARELARAGLPIDDAMDKFERAYIMTTLEQHRYSLAKTAEHLKLTRHALRYRMQRLNISTDSEPAEGAAAAPGKEGAPC